MHHTVDIGRLPVAAEPNHLALSDVHLHLREGRPDRAVADGELEQSCRLAHQNAALADQARHRGVESEIETSVSENKI